MPRRRASTNGLFLWVGGALALVVLLTLVAVRRERAASPRATGTGDAGSRNLLVFCAAGMRYPMEEIVKQYEQRYGVAVQLQYGGSNTLLNQLEVSRTGDLYLAADNSYIELARDKGLAAEAIPLAWMKPVIAVHRENPQEIAGVEDLLREDVKVAFANPDAAAVGKKSRKLLTRSGHWEAFEANVTEHGVFKPTVNEVANDIKLGSVHAGVVWDSTVAQYPELQAIATPELDAGKARVELAVLTSARDATAALHFARFAGARNAGLRSFEQKGYEVVDGDVWEDQPEITFYAGAVNRRALEPILSEFENREGVRINTVYNGCGLLTAQMRTMKQNQESGFPDAYMACDLYYLDTVQDWFEPGVQVSDTDIVLVVQKGNPKNLKGLEDLTRPGVRLAIGQPEQCTIGVLSKRLLDQAGIYEQLKETNVVTETATSAMLVPAITTGAADAALAYVTDTLAESERLDVVRLDSELAKAIQPYSVSRSSDYKHLGQRLYAHIARSRQSFEDAGFHWRLDPTDEPPAP